MTRRMGPLNFEVVREDMGEDLRVVNVAQLKPCYPSTEELDRKQRQQVLNIFQED